jgi:hypothetical protein
MSVYSHRFSGTAVERQIPRRADNTLHNGKYVSQREIRVLPVPCVEGLSHGQARI